MASISPSSTLHISLPSDREILLVRSFAAPRALVWQAWTEEDRITRWWAPRDYHISKSSMDFRAGGAWHYFMADAQGEGAWARMGYREIQAPERFVFIDSFSDEAGNEVPPAGTATVTFEEAEGRTTVTMHTRCQSPEDRDALLQMGMLEGIGESFDQLSELVSSEHGNALSLLLPNDTEIVAGRTLNAPPSLVFEALTNPDHLRRWWGPRQLEIDECTVDLRVGGSWRCVQRDPANGEQYVFSGEYREIVPGERLVQTWRYEAQPDSEAVETITLEPRGDGKTRLVGRAVYGSREVRDGHLDAGMEYGMREAYERLEELLVGLAR